MLSRMAPRLSQRMFTKTYNVLEITANHKSFHSAPIYRHTAINNSTILNISRNKLLPVSASFVRYSSTGDDKVAENVLPSIPDAPLPPAPEVIDILSAAGEPALSTLGLGGYSPAGLVQTSLEYLHITAGLPWWGTILIGTICVRLLLFPLVIKAQRNSTKMNNHLPQIQAVQLKMSEARETGNQFAAAAYTHELANLMKSLGISPWKSMMVPLVQAPVFLSFFWGLRGMANAPVASMREGGLWWFTDLTVPDPYYLLPVITTATLWITIKIGVDGIRLQSQTSNTVKYFIQAMPFIAFPFMINFDGAILCYWVSSNFISLIQATLLRIPTVRDFFNIERAIQHDPSTLPIKNKGFVRGVKDSISNMKKANELAERAAIDELEFERAGKGPVPKTFKYDPTKQAPPAKSILARKRE